MARREYGSSRWYLWHRAIRCPPQAQEARSTRPMRKQLQSSGAASKIADVVRTGWRELQRPDLHLAPFDGAAGGSFFTIAELKRDRTFRELAVLDIGGFGAVEHDR